jgi:glycosyltransferase involved in cell wall biosynthesis
MKLSEYLTIVIPCKNESKIIDLSLSLLNFQNGVDQLKVIVADSSDDNITKNSLLNRNGDKFNLEVISGGLPSVARNNGSKIVTTPYILFMDSDMFILDSNLIYNSLGIVINNEFDLLTTKVRTTNGKYNYVFKTFDIIQKVIKPFGPFCLGGLMLFNRSTFNQLGGFDESAIVAEDYLLSKKISPHKFKLSNKMVFTTPRRFEDKGIWYMIKLMISSFLNRNNKKFFHNHNTYWK